MGRFTLFSSISFAVFPSQTTEITNGSSSFTIFTGKLKSFAKQQRSTIKIHRHVIVIRTRSSILDVSTNNGHRL